MMTTKQAKPEPLLNEEDRRYVLFPIKHPDIWSHYKNLLSTFWVPEEICLDQDVIDYNEKLTDNERHWLDNVLAFFASSDVIVNLNLISTFGQEVVTAEASCFYSLQMAQENVHSETYSLFIDRLCEDEKKARLFDALEKMPAVAKKAKWALKWANPELDFATRIVAWATVEGLLFAASFAAIAFLKQRGLMPGLGLANEFISRDESLHCSFASECLYQNHIVNKLPEAKVHAIIREAVEIEDEFVTEALPVKLIGMNADDMKTYVRFCANRLLQSLGVSPLYKNATCPWEWIQLISVNGQTSFFEKKVADYAKSSLQKMGAINFDNAF